MKRGVIALTLMLLPLVIAPAATSQTGTRYLDEVFGEVSVTKDIVYGRSTNYLGVDQDLRLDLYEPVKDKLKERAVFIWAHGGFFTSGDKSDIAKSEPNSVKDFMTRRGWVTISVNYRLNPTLPQGIDGYAGSGDPNAVFRATEAIRNAQHDVQAAVRWVRANAKKHRLDPDRIATGGFSAGATTSMAVAYNSDDPGDSGNPGHPSNVQAAIGTGTGNVPGVDIHPDPLVEPPVAMYHGENDQLIPWPIPRAACLAAQAMLNVCEFHLYAGEGHSARNGIADWPAFLHEYVIRGAVPLLHQEPGSLPTIPAVHVPPDLVPAP